ncbi:unnamed protein product [Pieris macdunnoughi]|uniref:Lysozyme n=1 Tax=Pieris macdunnoughi TaxID=345717 RepID=A0A821MI86_9NEOP|nr:unnamed protein product [Pieris macdunnoughi]
MAARCVLGAFFICSIFVYVAEAKVFTRCQLTREFLKTNFHQKTFLSNWVCLIEQESGRNTSALNVKSSRKQYYGLFQLGNEYCKEGRKGGKCNVACEALLDEEIRDDCACALKVFEEEGFKYWTKWENRCKGERLPDIEKCPDWQYPPRASPDRLKRNPRNIAPSTNMLAKYQRLKRLQLRKK